MDKSAAMAEVTFGLFMLLFNVTMLVLFIWALITHGSLSW
jgi:hypothetical protein